MDLILLYGGKVTFIHKNETNVSAGKAGFR